MISDEELTAWLDGELPPDQAEVIAQALTRNGDLADRLTALKIDKSALDTAFQPLLALAPGGHPAMRARAGRSALAASVVLAIGLGLGGWLGWAWFSPTRGWQVEVAHYQALYVADTMAPIDADPARIGAELKVAGDKLGLALDSGALGGFEGLTLRRAQVLGFEGRVLVQIAYTKADGTPVAFCILGGGTGAQSGLTSEMLSGLATTSWQGGGFGFLTIGGQDSDQMRRFAAYLRNVI